MRKRSFVMVAALLILAAKGVTVVISAEWRITKRHMRTRYTIGDPVQKAIVGRIS